MPNVPAGAKKPTDRKKKPTAAQRRKAENRTDVYAGTLDGHTIRVLPRREWRKSAIRALRTGDLDTWADSAIHPDDAELFKQLDPTLGEFDDFSRDAIEFFGVDAGE